MQGIERVDRGDVRRASVGLAHGLNASCEGHGEDGEHLELGISTWMFRGPLPGVMWVCLSLLFPIVLSCLISYFLAEFFY